jgi:hypothetical protein
VKFLDFSIQLLTRWVKLGSIVTVVFYIATSTGVLPSDLNEKDLMKLPSRSISTKVGILLKVVWNNIVRFGDVFLIGSLVVKARVTYFVVKSCNELILDKLRDGIAG